MRTKTNDAAIVPPLHKPRGSEGNPVHHVVTDIQLGEPRRNFLEVTRTVRNRQIWEA